MVLSVAYLHVFWRWTRLEGKGQGKVLASGQNHIIPDQQQLYQDFVMSE